MHTYIVSWYGTEQIETPSIHLGTYNTELHHRVGSSIFKLPHSMCEDDYFEWVKEIQEENELYMLPSIIAISEIGTSD